MGFYNANIYQTQFFKFSCPNIDNEVWTIPATVTEGTDGVTISSEWSRQNVQGGTEAMSAFNYVNNPNLNIDLKFNADLFREFNVGHTYSETIAKLGSLQYPGGTATIISPYVIISWCGQIYRGYFTNMKIVCSGPLRLEGNNKYIRPFCNVTGSFIVVKSTSPKRIDIQTSFPTIFGS